MHSSYNYIPLANVDQQVSENTSFTISSPILYDLLKELSVDEYYEILDILPAKQELLNSVSHLSCKLHLPGCLNDLVNIKSDKYDTNTKLHRAFTKALGFYKKKRALLNVIFLWDLPNYLDKEVITGLVAHLSHHMDEKVTLHFYIHTKQQMPESAGVYSMKPEGKILVENNSASTIKSPLYFQETLHSMFHPFKVKRSTLLSGGMQEYILER